MTVDQFIKKSLNSGIDYDGVAGVQCVDLIMNYLDNVYNLKGVIYADAHHYYNNFNNYSVLKNNFERIKNTPEFIPIKGDICVFNKSSTLPWGHICIATGKGTTKYFESIDQNYGGKECRKVNHNYNGFLGVLRFKKSKCLDVIGISEGDSGLAVYAIKRMMSKIPTAKNKMDENGIAGKGTISNINAILKEHGYIQNGIAGENFIKLILKELE